MHSECRTFTTYISIVMIYKTVVLDNLKTISVKEEKTEEMCVEPGTMKIEALLLVNCEASFAYDLKFDKMQPFGVLSAVGLQTNSWAQE
ncbi:uncharacterized protein LOC126213158 isoform X2 [Schistocerca nitens]|uniref:uncharacterized protein LOC126213158 isoform X2 n=1 Tax=Schistocerca nitens TaxID=7011 RepID=UPI002117EF29|nr:uncharacterized protein LOC126213158 isoform X2 [Schistocerca nitens]